MERRKMKLDFVKVSAITSLQLMQELHVLIITVAPKVRYQFSVLWCFCKIIRMCQSANSSPQKTALWAKALV